jgi:CAAX protease family protein
MRIEGRPRQQAIIVIVVSTLCYCLMDYHSPFHQRTWDGVLFYLAIPLVTILLLQQNPLRWGLSIGEWKWTLGLTLAGVAGVSLLLLGAVRLSVFRSYYNLLGPEPSKLWPWTALFVIDMLVWEFFFRGFMLFGLEPALGEMAIYVQMIPFAIAHIGKPELETLSSIAGGILIGYMVRRCRSFWPAFLLHTLIGLVMYML